MQSVTSEFPEAQSETHLSASFKLCMASSATSEGLLHNESKVVIQNLRDFESNVSQLITNDRPTDKTYT
jgi:hypothetical protein